MNKAAFMAVAIGTLIVPKASASLILSSTTPVASTGNGLGAVTTILTVTSPGNSTAESGCVSAAGINTGCQNSQFTFTGQTQQGNSQTGLRALSSVTTSTGQAITNGNQLQFLFNASQPPGQTATGITLNELNVLFYTSVGGTLTLLDAATFTGPQVLPRTLNGTGQAGIAFQLDAAEAALITANLGNNIVMGGSIVAGCGGTGTVNGTTAPACNTTTFLPAVGGLDVLQVRAISAVGGQVPEPTSSMLFGSGLVALGLVRRQFGKKKSD